jgi:hypothetical protein
MDVRPTGTYIGVGVLPKKLDLFGFLAMDLNGFYIFENK